MKVSGAPRLRLTGKLPRNWCLLAEDQQEQCATRGLSRKGLVGPGEKSTRQAEAVPFLKRSRYGGVAVAG